MIAVLWGVGLTVYEFAKCSRNRIDKLDPKEMRYVMTSCPLGEKRVQQVIHSFAGSEGGPGDHLYVCAIKLTTVSLEELTANTCEGFKGRWYRGDQLPKVVDDTVPWLEGWLHNGQYNNLFEWFPKGDELRSQDVYAYPCWIDLADLRPYAATIIFVRPKDKMLFFFDGKS